MRKMAQQCIALGNSIPVVATTEMVGRLGESAWLRVPLMYIIPTTIFTVHSQNIYLLQF
jgi:hypothetical protein